MKKKMKNSSAKKAFKKVKEKSVSWWKKKAWNVFSKWIRERDNYTCITCGKKGRGSFMHAGHYISRKHSATMFNERNVHAQCMNCNMWGYGNMGVYTLKLQEKYGAEIVKDLTEESQKTRQFTVEELKALILKYNG
jgi:5-methylcytosine-specific restriction endonuclease McrA